MVMLEVQEKWQQFTKQDQELQEQKLKETLIRAYQSPLYKKLWKQAHVNPDILLNISDLNQFPFLTRKLLFETTRAKPNKTSIAPVSQWFLGYDQPDTHEWYPYSAEDFMAIAPMLTRMSHTVGLQKGDIVLVIVDTPPRIGSFIPYLWSYAEVSKGCGLEFIIGALEWYDALGMSWINFIQRRRPTAIFASTRNAKAFAEKLGSMNTSVRDVLPEARIGIFYGEQQNSLSETYSTLEKYQVYSPIEHMAFWSECPSHSGVHVWLDTCVPEIIPVGHQKAQLLSESAEGTEGELVLTTFSKALPLIRYKSGKFVHLESSECSCGCSHPKIRFR